MRTHLGVGLTLVIVTVGLPGGCPLDLGRLPTDEPSPAAPDDALVLTPTEQQEIRRSLTNTPPTAVAGPDIVAAPHERVRLSATGSHDPDGDGLLYEWSQVGDGPEVTFIGSRFNSIVAFDAPAFDDRVVPTLTLTFRVQVSDGYSTSSDVVSVFVTYTP